PRRDHDIALDALWTWRLGLGQFAFGDAVGPISEIFEGDAAEIPGKLVGHLLAGLSRLNAPHPGSFAGIELAESCGNRASSFLAELMTTDAADVLHLLQPVILRKFFGNVALAAELAGGRNFYHCVPVDRRIIMGRRRFVW